MKIARTSTPQPETRGVPVAGEDVPLVGLPADAFDDRIAIVGTAGSGKTYAAKGFVERLLESGARVAIVDPLGVWWGLRASADGSAPGYPVIVFGGKHADVSITSDMGAALGRIVAREALVCVVDLSDLGSNAARRRFMAAFAEALYETNEEPLHLVLDEADLWAPQRPIKGWEGLLGHVEEIVRRGRVRGFIPWLITQRPAVVHKDVLSQADILIAMKLTASQDRDSIGAWIEGQADRQEGKRILGDLPRLLRGEGYLWAPGHGLLERISFPQIRTFVSSRTPKRGERLAVPRTLAEVDLTAIVAALATSGSEDARKPSEDRSVHARLEQDLALARVRIAALEENNRELHSRLAKIAALAGGVIRTPVDKIAAEPQPKIPGAKPVRPSRVRTPDPPTASGNGIHPAARKLLIALAQHAPARFTWGQAATLAGLKPSGGHFNSGRKDLRTEALWPKSPYRKMCDRINAAVTLCHPQLLNPGIKSGPLCQKSYQTLSQIAVLFRTSETILRDMLSPAFVRIGSLLARIHAGHSVLTLRLSRHPVLSSNFSFYSANTFHA
jgi:Helicase HerA, central domain